MFFAFDGARTTALPRSAPRAATSSQAALLPLDEPVSPIVAVFGSVGLELVLVPDTVCEKLVELEEVSLTEDDALLDDELLDDELLEDELLEDDELAEEEALEELEATLGAHTMMWLTPCESPSS